MPKSVPRAPCKEVGHGLSVTKILKILMRTKILEKKFRNRVAPCPGANHGLAKIDKVAGPGFRASSAPGNQILPDVCVVHHFRRSAAIAARFIALVSSLGQSQRAAIYEWL